MVKDVTNRLPGNAGWGGGWGWALFEASDPDTDVVTNWRLDCLGCHMSALEDDYIYLQGYPLLASDD